MPQKTNPFQSLMTQINAALHGKKAKVEESVMVYNYNSETETEIDILITFEIGGNTYKTAIECQDRSRPAGPPWISELMTKRDGCRLSKMIAVHSKGFTKSAKKLAEKYGIETLTPEVITEIDWQSKVGYIKQLAFQSVKCKLKKNELNFSLIGNCFAKPDEATSLICIPRETDIYLKEFINNIREEIREGFSKRFDLTGKTKPDFSKRNMSMVVDLFVTFPDNTVLKPNKGDSLLVISASGEAEIVVDTNIVDELTHIKQKDEIVATHADFKLMGHKASITLTEQKERKNEIGICMTWEGGKINGFKVKKEKISSNVRVYVKERCKKQTLQ